MSMKEWAKEEVRIACERERGGAESYEWEYGCACYESALKAYESLLGDGHSGMSIGITKQILDRLIDGKPLTPIEDTEDIWSFGYERNGEKHYQCTRRSSLFKYVKYDGSVSYSDVNRIICKDKNTGGTHYSGFVRELVEEIYPITFPYCPPDKPYIVYTDDFLVDEKNGDFDTLGIFHVVDPDGDMVNIERYFKEDGDGWEEIGLKEYNDRARKAIRK